MNHEEAPIRYARALGAADAAIDIGLVYCNHPGEDLGRFVEQMRELLTKARADIDELA